MSHNDWLAKQPWYRRIVARLSHRIYTANDWIYERITKDLPDTDWRSRVWERLPESAKGVHRLVCRVVGHSPTPDHCGMPAHDYCEWCEVRTPHQAPRRARPPL